MNGETTLRVFNIDNFLLPLHFVTKVSSRVKSFRENHDVRSETLDLFSTDFHR